METHAEEDYLKAIYKIAENDPKPVSTKILAKQMDSKPSSVTDMIQRLSTKELVHYEKYKGFSLTTKGRQKALKVIRKHRLWELFLVKHLDFLWDEVHTVAEQLEHVSSTKLVNKLDAFLNFPTRDPHGDIIPDENGNIRKDDTVILTKIPIGQACTVICTKDSSSDFLTYLDQVGIAINTELTIVETYAYDNSIRVHLKEKGTISLSEKVSTQLYVQLKTLLK